MPIDPSLCFAGVGKIQISSLPAFEESWLAFESAAKAAECQAFPERSAVKLLPTYLPPTLLRQWRTHGDPIETLVAAKARIMTLARLEVLRDVALDQFHKRDQQPNERASEYKTELERLAQLAGIAVQAGFRPLLAKRMESGFRDKLKKVVLRARSGTPDDDDPDVILRRAEAEEKVQAIVAQASRSSTINNLGTTDEEHQLLINTLQMHGRTLDRLAAQVDANRGRQFADAAKYCNFCGRKGHVEAECWRKPPQTATPSRQGRQCYACGGYGHLQRDCPNNLAPQNTQSRGGGRGAFRGMRPFGGRGNGRGWTTNRGGRQPNA